MEKRRYQQYKTLINFDKKIENEYYVITPDAGGTITIYNKKDNTTYPEMHLSEDRGAAACPDQIGQVAVQGSAALFKRWPCTTPVVYASSGTKVFEYAIILNKGDVISEATYITAYEFNYGLRAVYNCDKPSGVLPLKNLYGCE